MQQYEFIVSRGDDILLRDVERLPGLDAAWGKVAEVAEKVDEPGARIRVHDEKGEIAIMMGVLAARAAALESTTGPPASGRELPMRERSS